MSKFYIIFVTLFSVSVVQAQSEDKGIGLQDMVFSMSVVQAQLETPEDFFDALTHPRKLTAQDQCDLDLGLRYLDEGKRGKARKLFKKVAKRGSAEAQYLLAFMYEEKGKYKKAFEWYMLAAEQGYAKAQYRLGVMYENGFWVPKDKELAFAWYQQAERSDSEQFKFTLAEKYLSKGDYQKAFELYKELAEQGHAKAQYQLGVMYEMGLSVPKDKEQAFEWYRKSIRNDQDQLKLASKYYYDKKDHQRALELYSELAEKGNKEAQARLAEMKEDKEQAQALAQSISSAQDQLDLANRYEKEGNHSRALELYKELAEKGHRKIQLRLAEMYEKGIGVEQDEEQAFAWYRRSIRNDRDHLNLANKYEREENHSRALELYSELAEKGNRNAQYRLPLVESEMILTKAEKILNVWNHRLNEAEQFLIKADEHLAEADQFLSEIGKLASSEEEKQKSEHERQLLEHERRMLEHERRMLEYEKRKMVRANHDIQEERHDIKEAKTLSEEDWDLHEVEEFLIDSGYTLADSESRAREAASLAREAASEVRDAESISRESESLLREARNTNKL